MARLIDRYGNPLIAVKQCSSATCSGSEIGCSAGDCIGSNHHAANARWRYWSIKRFRKIFDRDPRNFENQVWKAKK